MNTKKKHTLGVIVGRFQVPELHPGHKRMLFEALKDCNSVLVCVGQADTIFDDRYPIPYAIVKDMIESWMGDMSSVRIEYIADMADNASWSCELDRIISRRLVEVGVGEDANVILYGSRDSFLTHYEGVHSCKQIDELGDFNGTDVRSEILNNPHAFNDANFRSGMIYAVLSSPHPISFQTVDCAVWKENGTVLLARKRHEKLLRFPGGFVDVNDASFEHAARREMREELGDIEIDELSHIGSCRVRGGGRYENSRHKIMTAFFSAKYIFGHVYPQDDIIHAEWVPIEKIANVLVREHAQLGDMFLNYWSTSVNNKKA